MTAVTPEAFAVALTAYLRAWDAAAAEGVRGDTRTGLALRVALAEVGVTVGRPAPRSTLAPPARRQVRYDAHYQRWHVLDHVERSATLPLPTAEDAERVLAGLLRGNVVPLAPSGTYERIASS